MKRYGANSTAWADEQGRAVGEDRVRRAVMGFWSEKSAAAALSTEAGAVIARALSELLCEMKRSLLIFWYQHRLCFSRKQLPC